MLNSTNEVDNTHFQEEIVQKKRCTWISWKLLSDKVALVLLFLLIWGIGYSLFPDYTNLNSPLFRLSILFLTAKIVGVIVGYVRIPPMVGMLLIGVLFRNIGFINITGNYSKFTAVLRQLALVNIMLPAGLGLDPQALRKKKWMILNLAIVPVGVEVIALTLTAHFLLDLPWLWGILIGLLLAAVSPAVIIPCLFELQDMGYGVNKGIHTIVIAAATVNDIICIALFGIIIGLIFSTGSLLMQILQGPIVLAIGFTFGITWGIVCRYVPHQKETYLITLRTLLLGFGSVFSAIGSDAIKYGGAGALGCIVAAFVACLGWRKQGWSSQNPVRMNFVLLWKFMEPISFSLIGMEVDFTRLEKDTVLWGTIAMTIALVLRIVVSFASTLKSDFNLKENLFVALSWIPKATVQAALGPVALDYARNANDDTLIGYANKVIIVAVISILITSPIGAILIMQLGPKLLHRTLPEEHQGIANPGLQVKEEEEQRL